MIAEILGKQKVKTQNKQNISSYDLQTIGLLTIFLDSFSKFPTLYGKDWHFLIRHIINMYNFVGQEAYLGYYEGLI